VGTVDDIVIDPYSVPYQAGHGMKRFFTLLFVFAMGWLTPAVSGAETNELQTLILTHETEGLKILAAHDARLGQLLDAYGRMLDAAIGTLKKGGDPDHVLTAIMEKQRFDKERTVPTESPVERDQKCLFAKARPEPVLR